MFSVSLVKGFAQVKGFFSHSSKAIQPMMTEEECWELYEAYLAEQMDSHRVLVETMIERLARLYTPQKQVEVCQEILDHMMRFRLLHFNQDAQAGLNGTELCVKTYEYLSEWLEMKRQNNELIFELASYWMDERCLGFIYGGTSTIYLNTHLKNHRNAHSYALYSELESIIYHELTHRLQSIFAHLSGTNLDAANAQQDWEDLWYEKEAVYCDFHATQTRFYPADFSSSLVSMIDFYLQSNVETGFKLEDLNPFKTTWFDYTYPVIDPSLVEKWLS